MTEEQEDRLIAQAVAYIRETRSRDVLLGIHQGRGYIDGILDTVYELIGGAFERAAFEKLLHETLESEGLAI